MSTIAPRRASDVRSHCLEDEWVLYVPERGELHVLNRTAGAVWNLCDGGHSVDDICGRLAGDYELPTGTTLRSDVEDILGSLREKGLLR